MPITLACVGNPLLDFVSEVPESFFEKYNVKPGSACLVEGEQIHIYEDLNKNYSPLKIAGGCAHNSVRMFQALNPAGSTFLMGCLGKDEDGKTFEELVKKEGSLCAYAYSDEKPTGKCAVLVHNKERALCTELGACLDITCEHVEKNLDKCQEAKIIYTTGYVLSASPEAVKRLAEYSSTHGKIFAFNIAAEFLMHQFYAEYTELLQHSNILLGNRDEFYTFAKLAGMDENSSIGDVACRVLDMMVKGDTKNKTKIVVITQGADPVIIASSAWHHGTLNIGSYPIPAIPQEKILDLNGAGDGFVGGFLHGFINNKNADMAVSIGAYCAGNVIQHSGFDFDLSNMPAEFK